jgi:4-amino-4-deoxy-L-arabinose transferase-like glycosyltransferase
MTAVTGHPAHARAPEAPAGHGRLAGLLRGPDADPRWARPALIAMLVLTAALYTVGLSRNGWANDFYAAAVQAGTKSWKAFFFGSFDASNFITVDKTPASLWVMEISARIFGLNYWSLLVPQALEGVAAVGVLYATVRRWFGPAAGILAGVALATTPVAALMFRFNNPDALLVLLMTAAAYAVTRAIEAGKTRWLVLAGALLGFGFLAKMLQAFLVLPGFALVYLVAGPRGLGRRVWQLLVSGLTVLLAAGWWVAAVMLTPAADRPYVGGSTNDSILQLAFGYNGLGRLDGNETGSVGFSHGGGGGFSFSGSTGLTRLFASDMGGQISWLLPAALIALAALLWLTRRAPRTDRTRAGALLWGGWLLVTGGVFSYMAGIIHPYYTVALAPAIAALVGIGATALWRVRDGWRGHEGNWFGRAALAAGVAASTVWSYVLLDRAAGWQPWLRMVILAAGLIAVVAVLAGRWLSSIPATTPGRLALAALPVPFALVAVLAGPVGYSLDTVATAHTGALPSAGPTVASFGGPGGAGGPGGTGGAGGFGGAGAPGRAGSASGLGRSGVPSGSSGAGGASGAGGFGQPGGSGSSGGLGRGGATGGGSAGSRTSGRAGTRGFRSGSRGRSGALGGPGGASGGGFGGGLGGNTQVSSALTKLLKDGASGYRWAAATVSSDSAAPLQLASGEPIMSIGGFNGTDPAPTLAEFEKYVADHDIHYFIGANSHSFGGGSGDAEQITKWVEAHFRAETIGGEAVYNLST